MFHPPSQEEGEGQEQELHREHAGSIFSHIPEIAHDLADHHHKDGEPRSSSSSSSTSQHQHQQHRSRRLIADYAFTGSYFNVHREIMDLDPLQLPQWRGIIIGSGWNKATATASLSEAWRNMTVGSLPYSDMPQVGTMSD
jgi:hypothetical protein